MLPSLFLLVLTCSFWTWHFLGAYFFKGYNLMGTGMMFLILCAFFGVFYIGLEGIMTLYRDLNSKLKLYAVSDTKEQL